MDDGNFMLQRHEPYIDDDERQKETREVPVQSEEIPRRDHS